MKKIYTLIPVLFFAVLVKAQPFTQLWKKVPGSAGFTTWAANDNSQNSIDFNATTNHLLVAKRGSHIKVVDPTNGDSLSALVLPSTLDTYRFAKVRVTSDGVIYAISMQVTANGSCWIWRWANETATPTLCATFTVTERCGDSFGLSGSGNNTILYASGAGLTSGTINIYVLNTVKSINDFLSSKIEIPTSGSVTQWANRVVEPVINSLTSDLWILCGGGPARRITVGSKDVNNVRVGTVAFDMSTTTVSNLGGYGGMRYISNGVNPNMYLSFGGGNNATVGTKMKTINVKDEVNITTYGIDSLGDISTYVSNANGTGDVAYKYNTDGTYTLFFLSTNNGLAATKSDWTILPASLSNFKASIQNKNVMVEWSTTNETNNQGFAIEKSINGQDFSKIGFVNSKSINGNSSAVLSYQFVDAKLVSGKSYYRLKQLDKDGKTSISNIEVINNPFTGSLVINVLGNPVRNNLSLNVKSSINRNLQINISNASGNLLLTKQQTINTGENNFLIPISQLPNGVLFVTVKDKENNTTEQTIQLMKN